MILDKISIITPSLNRADIMEIAIRSVISQGYPNYEHVIVDGGSTDGSLELLKKYSYMKLICEPDKGIYDALNKGLKVATGEIIGFLNTDDLYADNIFFDVVSKFADENVTAVAGCAIVFYQPAQGNTEIVGRYSPKDKSLLECSTIGSNYFNAWFFRKSVFKKIGGFDVTYRIAGDRDFMLRFALSDLRYVTIDKLVYQYRQHPGSLTFHDTDQMREWSAREHLIMTNYYLKNEKLSNLQRKLLVELRTRETEDMTTRTLMGGDLRKAIYYFREGIKYDYLWLFKFAWSRIILRINKGINLARKVVDRIGKSILKNGR